MNSIEGEVREAIKELELIMLDHKEGRHRFIYSEEIRALQTLIDNAEKFLKLTNQSNELLPKVNSQYQCEHIKEKIIRSSCVWCNLTVAEKIIDRLKGELANLRPLEEKEVEKFLEDYEFQDGYSYVEVYCDNRKEMAKKFCSHFSKSQVVMSLRPLDEKDVEEFLRNTEPYKWWDTHLGKLAKDICSHFSKPDLKLLDEKVLKDFEDNLDANNPDGFRYSTKIEPRLADAEKVKLWLVDYCSHFSKPKIKWPEKKGILSKEDFNTMSDEAYSLKQERNIGYNQAVNDMKALNKED